MPPNGRENVTGGKRIAKYQFVPDALWGKFPNSWVLMLENGTKTACEMTMLLLSFCILYATLLGPPHQSEWLYLLAAILGPITVAAWYIAFPFNPYRSMAAIRERMKNLDHSDEDAREFVVLLKSPRSHRFLLNMAWKLSLILSSPMAIIFVAMKRIPVWRLGADSLVRIPLFLFVCLFVLFRIELLSWALKSWKTRKNGCN